MSTAITHLPDAIQDAANEIIEAAGLTVDEVVQRLMQRIAREHAVPQDLLYPQSLCEDDGEEQQKARGQAIEEFKVLRKKLNIAPISIEEIISARDEGRR